MELLTQNHLRCSRSELDITMKSIASLSNDSVVVGCKEGGVFTYNTDGYKITDMQSKPHKGDVNDIIKVDDNTFATTGGNTINIWEYKFI